MSTEDGSSELRGLIPRILQSLHAKKVWESVKSAEEIRCEHFKDLSKPHIGILTPVDTEESPVVVKFESRVPCGVKFFKIEPQTVEIHQILSDHGLATKLLAFSLRTESDYGENNNKNSNLEPNFTVETVGVCYFDLEACKADPNYFDMANSATGTGGVMAKLAARLHKNVQVQWFDKYRCKTVGLCPLMGEEGPDSPLWVMMRTDALGQARLAAKLKSSGQNLEGKGHDDAQANPVTTNKFLNQKRAHAPTNEDMKRIVSLLPKPCGQYASRVVTVHGDLWAANVVKDTRSNEAVLIDLEGVTVSYAATDLAQFRDQRGVSKIYLEEMMEGQGMPTDEDIDRFWFEVLIAGQIQTDFLRTMCWEDATLEPESVAKMIAFVERFSEYVEKLRSDWPLALKILREAAAAAENGGDMEQWCSEETIESVLCKSS